MQLTPGYLPYRSASILVAALSITLLTALPSSGSETLPGATPQSASAFSLRITDDGVKVGLDGSGSSGRTEPTYAVSVSGDIALVGAGWHNQFRGAVYVLERQGDDWVEVQEILPPEGTWPAHFGDAVFVDGDRAVIGAPWENMFAGAAHVYRRIGDTWVEEATVVAPEGRPDDRFGTSVSIAGDQIIVHDRIGSAAFRRRGELWTEAQGSAVLTSPHLLATSPPLTPQFIAAVSALQARATTELEAAAIELPDSLDWVAATDGLFEDRVEVRWPSLNTDAVLYKIYRDLDAIPDTLIGVASSDDSLFVDFTGFPETTYTYSVVASDLLESETAPTSDEGTRIIRQAENVLASDGDYEDHVEISWDDRSEIEAGYLISRTPGPDPLATLGANTGLYRDSTAVPGEPYEYGVRAFDAEDFQNDPVTNSGYAGYILPPIQVDASDGQYPDLVILTWVNQTTRGQSLNIYRELVGVEPTDPFDSLPPGQTQYTDPTAVPGTEYVYCVAAVDSLGRESAHGCNEGGADILQAPLSASATNGTYDDRVALTWVHETDTQDGFRVYRAPSGQPEALVGEFEAAVRSYDDMDAVPDEDYTYWVEAFSEHGGVSSRVQAQGRRSVVVKPDWVTATDGTLEDRVDVEWQSSSTTAVLFKIARNGEPIKTVASYIRSYSDEDIPSDSVLVYSVSAITALAVESDTTNDTGSRTLKPPTSVQASDNTFEERVDITWTNASGFASGYRVYRRPVDETTAVLVDAVPAARENYSDKTGSPGVMYEYSVRAFHTYGIADLDTTESVSDFDTGYRVLPFPTEVEASDGEFEDRIRITWVDIARFEEGYQIWRKAAGADSDSVAIAWLPRNTNSYTDSDTTLAFGLPYQYTVVAVDSSFVTEPGVEIGLSEAISDEGYTTILGPAAVNASDSYEDRVTVAWVDRSDIEDGYLVYRDAPSSVVPSHAVSYGLRNVVISAPWLPTLEWDGGQVYSLTAAGTEPNTIFEGAAGTDWHHILVTYDADLGSNQHKVYLDGSLVAEMTSDSRLLDTAGLVIGGHRGGAINSRNWDGWIDDVAFWDRVLTTGEIANLQGSAALTVPSSMVAHWSFDESFQATVGGPRYQGIPVNGVSIHPSGRFESAAHFERTNKEYIEVLNPVIEQGRDHTYSAWYKLTVPDIQGGDRYFVLETTRSPIGPLIGITDEDATSFTDGFPLPGETNEYCVRSFAGSDTSETPFIGTCDWGGAFTATELPQVSRNELYGLAAKLTSSVRTPNDRFGNTVAISGDVALVGAQWAEDYSGSAYVFRNTGSSWTQEQRLIPEDVLPYDYFGEAVAISGDVAIVGAYGHDAISSDEGAAYVFRWNGESWVQEQKLTDEDGALGDQYGFSVAISGDVALVGVKRDDANSGSAFVYRWDGASWIQEEKLTVPDGGGFGCAVAISGDRALVGAYGDDDGGMAAGSAYFFHWNGSSWVQQPKLIGFYKAFFGRSVAISGDMALIGAPGWDGVGGALIPGTAYAFRWTGSNWTQVLRINDPDDSVAGDEFGVSVAVSGETALIGRGNGDSRGCYLFRWNGSSWNQEQKVIDGKGGEAVATSGDVVLIGTDWDPEAPGGSASVFTTNRPREVAAADGRFSTGVQVRWKDTFDDETGFNIYRDGVFLDYVPANTLSFLDSEADPGLSMRYGVTAFGNGWESATAYDLGFRKPNGSITGRISTESGAGVEGVQVHLNPAPNGALLFDGWKGRLRIDDPSLPDTALTVEFWLRSADITNRGLILLSHCQDILAVSDVGDLQFMANGDTTGSTGISVNDGEWHHLAVTWSSAAGDWIIFKDGIESAAGTGLATGSALVPTGPMLFGGSGFQGELDDIRMWNYSRSANDILATMDMPLRGNENGLVAYWPLDLETGEDAQDLTVTGNHAKLQDGSHWTDQAAPLNYSIVSDLEGNFSLSNLRYGESALQVMPLLPSRQFQPPYKSISLSTQNPVQNNVAFVDVSSFTVSGTATYAYGDSVCLLVGAEILVGDQLKGTTDGYGEYAVSVPPGTHDIGIRLGNHTFAMPVHGDIEVLDNIADLDFLDTTTRSLVGRVGGGCGFSLGTVSLQIRSEDGCLIETTTADSTFEMQLPPLTYYVEVTGIEPESPSIMSFFDRMGAQPVDLTDEPDTVDFVYRAPLVLNIEFPELPACPLGPGDTDIPVIEQGDLFPVLITVDENYGSGNLCPLDQGVVTIYDEISDLEDDPITLEIEDGEAIHTVLANSPNIFQRQDNNGFRRDHQKHLTVVARTPGRNEVERRVWVVVTGHRPRAAAFTAKTEEIPIYILRDPPGDASYSSLSTSTTIKTTLDTVKVGDKTNKIYGDIKWGTSKKYFKTFGDVKFGVKQTHKNKTTISTTVTDAFRTSDNDLFVGPDGDVFFGVALKLSFSITDVVEMNEQCEVTRTEDLSMGVDDLETHYLFTAAHIRDTVIPQLQRIQPADSAFYESAIDNWQSILSLNDSLKMESQFEENRSFSAGTKYQFTKKTGETTSRSTSTNAHVDWTLGAEAQFDVSLVKWLPGQAIKVGYSFNMKTSTTTEAVYDTSRTTTVGYTLSDNDIGDYFSVNVKTDPVYGTPVFELDSEGGGASSCPYEDGTQPRDGPRIETNDPVLTNVPPDEPAVFTLWLNNDSQSEEVREYFLTPITSTNPGGAILRANGTLLETEGMSFFLEPATVGQPPYEVTLSVERGPTKYRYENISMMLVPKCEYERWQRGVIIPLDMADTLTVTVEFDAPCSDIALVDPASGWAFGESEQVSQDNTLALTLGDFEFTSPDTVDSLLYIGAEYRRKDTEKWVRIRDSQIALTGRVSRSTLRTLKPTGDDPFEVTLNWDLSDTTGGRTPVVDGVYDLRAFTECGGGMGFSAIATGRIDRKPPKPLGKPQPSDGTLSLGENVSMRFNEPIDCGALDDENFIFTYLEESEVETVTVEWSCSQDGTIVITPTSPSLIELEGKVVSAKILGVPDMVGNPSDTVSWEPSFTVEQRSFNWAQTVITRDVSYRNPEGFSVNLVNGLGIPLGFHIENLPSWLTASAEGDSIPSKETLPVLFDVLIDSTMAIGDSISGQFNAVAYGSGIDTVRAGLEVGFKLVCQPPTWALNPSDYEHSMNAVIEARICPPTSICETSAAPTDMLAAFVGNQLRGLARPEEVTVNGVQKHLYFLTVYSNLSWGETVRFRIWDDSDCLLYTDANKAFTFDNNTIEGNLDDPLVLNALQLAPGDDEAVPVNEGWTWFSLNRRSDVDILTPWEVLGNLNPGSGDQVKSQTQFSQFNTGKGWEGSLQAFDNVSMYMIHLSEAGTIQYEGQHAIPSMTPVPIGTGWNWIGYVPETATSVSDALAPIDSSLSNRDLIKSQYAFAQYDSAGGNWVGSLQVMEPGLGYKLFLRAPVDTAIIYSPTKPNARETAPASPSSIAEALDLGGSIWSVNPRAYQYNMTLTAELNLGDGETLTPHHAIAALVGDEVRGVAHPMWIEGANRHLVFLMIYGNDPTGEEIVFRAYDPEDDVFFDIVEEIAFEADGMAGTVDSPVALTGYPTSELPRPLPAAFALGHNYPNPLGPTSASTAIPYALPQQEHVVLRVFSVSGRLVTTLVDKPQPAGWYEVPFSAGGLARGVYFYVLSAGEFRQVQKMTILR